MQFFQWINIPSARVCVVRWSHSVIVVDGSLNLVDVYVAGDRNDRGELCKSMTEAPAYINLQCIKPIVGQYVKLENTARSGIRICEIDVMGK